MKLRPLEDKGYRKFKVQIYSTPNCGRRGIIADPRPSGILCGFLGGFELDIRMSKDYRTQCGVEVMSTLVRADDKSAQYDWPQYCRTHSTTNDILLKLQNGDG
jgi:hypothetical protein